jgi:hypothetical protein
MSTEFVDAVRKVLKDGGFAKKDSEQEEGGVFLIGVSGRLFRLESDYQVGWTTDGYDACGFGAGRRYPVCSTRLVVRARCGVSGVRWRRRSTTTRVSTARSPS